MKPHVAVTCPQRTDTRLKGTSRLVSYQDRRSATVWARGYSRSGARPPPTARNGASGKYRHRDSSALDVDKAYQTQITARLIIIVLS